MRPLFLPLLLLLTAAPARAGVRVRLPLDGYYRPGRYMPVSWEGNDRADALAFRADGAATTSIASPADHGVAPWLMIREHAGDARWAAGASSSAMPSLHALGDDEKLVGVAGAEGSPARGVFGDAKVVQVSLDAADPLPGPGVAWEALDALVIDAAALPRLTDATRRSLYASGTALIVAGEAAPDSRWPWQHVGNAWVVRGPLAPPPSVSAEAYDPLEAWNPGRGVAFRRQVVLLGAAGAIVLAGMTLWRSRWALAAAAGGAAAMVAIIGAWDARQSTVVSVVGDVIVSGTPRVRDTWVWQRSPRRAEAEVPWAASLRPVFYDPEPSTWGEPTIACDPDGTPRTLRMALAPDWPVAMVSRAVEDAQTPAAVGPVRSPLRRLVVGSFYPRMRIVGQSASSRNPSDGMTVWDDVVVEPRRP